MTRYNFLRTYIRRYSYKQLHLFDPIPPETIDHLRQNGYAVLDNFVPESTRETLLTETQDIITTEFAEPNKTHFVPAQGSITRQSSSAYDKSAVVQAEMSVIPPQFVSRFPILSAIHHGADIAAQASVFWPRLTLTEHAVKVQITKPPGAFPIHVDAAANHDNRLVTAIIYPHHNWLESKAGALRLYPTPLSHVDISPVPGRLVLLSSRCLHHRVLPTYDERTSVTVWMSGSIRSTPLMVPIKDLSSTFLSMFYLLTPRFRDVSFKLALADEWILSLQQSHSQHHADLLIDNFRRDIQKIRDYLPSALCAVSVGTPRPNIEELTAIFKSPDALREAFSDLEGMIGKLPFIW